MNTNKQMNKIFFLLLTIFLISCNSSNELDKKGLQVEEVTDSKDSKNVIKKDSLDFKVKSLGVLLTGNPNVRIAPLFKLNYNEKDKTYYTGSSEFHYNYYVDDLKEGNYWQNIIPGFDALYGYNLVNIFHFDHQENKGKNLFEKPVLIKTCYYPSSRVDTLSFQPLNRNFYMISVYDEDTNNDKYINSKDLRRFYFFDKNGENMSLIIPKKYSVIGADYDADNDYLYINAIHDLNKDGKTSDDEPISIFYINLKNPALKGLIYEN